MRVEEAEAVGSMLAGLSPAAISPLLNIGSSTRRFRTENQPHIHRSIFGPLESRGVKVVHADLKAADGVDLVGDVLDVNFREHIRSLGPRAILCSNVLEHVADVGAFVGALEDLTPPGGLLLVTVPRSYPYHLDPVDNRFRPTPAALADEFQRCRSLTTQLVLSGTYLDELKQLPIREVRRRLVKSAWRVWLPFYKPASYKNLLHRWLWLTRRYSVSVALMERLPEERLAPGFVRT